MPERPEGLIYGVDERPPWPLLLLLGLQYAGLLSVYLVLIVIVFRAAGASAEDTRSAVSLGMVAIAAATMLQALRKGPLGSGYLAAPVFSAIYLGPSVLTASSVGLPAVFGMTMLAGLLQILLSRFLSRLRIFFPPAISGFIVVIVGIELGLVAVDHILAIEDFGNPGYRTPHRCFLCDLERYRRIEHLGRRHGAAHVLYDRYRLWLHLGGHPRPGAGKRLAAAQ